MKITIGCGATYLVDKKKKKKLIPENYNFDVNKTCYCNVCERYYKNYARFRIHMIKVHYPND